MVKMPESVETADVRHFFLKTFFYKNFLTHLKYSLNLIQNLLFLKILVILVSKVMMNCK